MRRWNLETFLRRLEAIKQAGSIDELVEQVPDLAAFMRGVEFRLADLDPIERILRAMTLEERLNPELLKGDDGGLARRQRIAASSGASLDGVDSLISHFEMLREMLETRSPDQVARELIDESEGPRESWQSAAPDAWKAGLTPVAWTEEDDVPEVDEEEPEVDLDAQVDEILRKINRSGMDSLNAEERELLEQASQRYRQ